MLGIIVVFFLIAFSSLLLFFVIIVEQDRKMRIKTEELHKSIEELEKSTKSLFATMERFSKRIQEKSAGD